MVSTRCVTRRKGCRQVSEEETEGRPKEWKLWWRHSGFLQESTEKTSEQFQFVAAASTNLRPSYTALPCHALYCLVYSSSVTKARHHRYSLIKKKSRRGFRVCVLGVEAKPIFIMLGFAFSEAQRSQEIMRRLHEQKGTTHGNGSAVQIAGGETNKAGGHKRTRRRRRPKKPLGGGGATASIGSSTAATTAASSLARTDTSGGVSRRWTNTAATTTSKKQHDAPMTRRDLYFALRCGMVQIGPNAMDTAVGRVTLVNWDNEIVVDTFVKVPVPITDYRTATTGITPDLLKRGAASLDSVRKKVGSLIRGKILIGHGLEVDLAALRIAHPICDTRDTATYAPYMQQIDPRTGLLLPRRLEDLIQHALQEPIPPEQPLLLSEAVACLSLYKAVRTQWEAQLVSVVQQKERQRELMLSMRSSPARAGELPPVGPGLSRIAEDAIGDDVNTPAHRHAWPSEYETSTLASDLATLENYEMYRDDVSETSSFVTYESELDGALRRTARKDTDSDLHPLFENLHLLPEFKQSSPSDTPQGTVGSNTVAGSKMDEWTIPEGSTGTSHHSGHQSGIWSPLPTTGAVASASDGNWSKEPREIMAAAHNPVSLDPDTIVDTEIDDGPQSPPVSLTEEELRKHLPAHLLDDIEVASPRQDQNNKTVKEEQDEPKKKSWFGFGRRNRSSSVPSAAEASFAELKAGGSKLSMSDRIPRRTKFLGSEPPVHHVDTSSRSAGSRSHSVSSEDALRRPPGF